jgi:ACS family D-galactonate transporter-like MFS transporter
MMNMSRVATTEEYGGLSGRWRVASLLGAGTFVCYLDRVNLSIAASPIAHDLGFNNTQLGLVLSAFLWSYAAAQIPVGILVDRFGTRWPILISIVLWAASSIATVAVQTIGAMLLVRLVLGLAEAPMMPAFWRSITLWFGIAERGRSNTILDIGSKLSYVIGVPAMAWIVSRYGWHACFFLTGIVTAGYGILFFAFYREPALHAETIAPARRAKLGDLIGSRKLWGVALGFSAYVYIYYLLATWMPRLLQDQLGISVLRSGIYTAVPWIFAIACEIVIGGWLIDRMVQAGASPGKSRQWILALSLLASLALLGAVTSHSTIVVLACLSISAAGLAVSTPTAGALIGLISPRSSVGSVGALINFIANGVGLCAPIVTGWIVDKTGSFYGAGVIAGIVVLVGVGSYTWLLGTVEPIQTTTT